MRQHQPVNPPTPTTDEAPPGEAASPVSAPEPAAAQRPPAAKPARRPSPHHLAELSGTFAMTASVHDPEPADEDRHQDDHRDVHHQDERRPDAHQDERHHEGHHHDHHDEVVSERGLRGLVGGGASQVSVSAAMRARDAARPTDDDLAAAERDLQIIRRGWVPREELTRPGRRSPAG